MFDKKNCVFLKMLVPYGTEIQDPTLNGTQVTPTSQVHAFTILLLLTTKLKVGS
jgi:hypothetical protein